MFAEFSIVSSTKRIDLLAANKSNGGFGMEAYTPGRSALKSDGVWQNSPIAHGRRLTYAQRDNVVDALTLHCSYPSHAAIIQDMRTLDELIEQTYTYWTTAWQDDPVWIEAMAYGDSARRYALIYNMELANYADPYIQPYMGSLGRFVLSPIALGIERSPWQDVAPQTSGDDVAVIGSQHTTATTSGVHVGNRRATGLTNIYYYDDSITTFSGNLLSASLPYALFPATIANSDILYIGSTDPFGNAVFDIGTATDDLAWTLTWQYYDGATWSTLTVVDNTFEFSETGVNHVRWDIPDDWATTAINGVTVYWVRAIASSVSGQTTPTQQNRHIYTALSSYVEVAEDAIDGDIDALALVRALLEDVASAGVTKIGFILAGLRSVDRGSAFVPWLNVVTADNVTGITATLGGNSHTNPTTAEVAVQSSTGVVAEYIGATGDTIGGSSTNDAMLFWVIDESIVEQWRGRYRILVRMTTDALAGDTQLRFWCKFTNGLFTNRVLGETRTNGIQTPTPYPFEILDLGFVNIPPTNALRSDESYGAIQIGIDALTTDGETVQINDVFLLPTDEWSAEVNSLGATMPNTSYSIELDGITYPKHRLRSVIRLADDDKIDFTPRTMTNNEAILHASTQQRLWFLFGEVDTTTGVPQSRPSQIAQVSLEANERFHFLR